MAGQIQIEELVAELEIGSSYKHIDNEELGYYHYEAVQFVFDKDQVKIFRRHGYDGEEDMASEWFDAEWYCVLPRQIINGVLSGLVRAGRATLTNVDITENYSGRRAYGIPGDNTRYYKTNLELTLRVGQKPVIDLQNSEEIRNAGSL